MQVYELDKNDILEAVGSFAYVGESNGKIYVEGEDLSEPFIPSSLPKSLQDTINAMLEALRKEKEKELNAKCDELLQSFKSRALGQTYIYDMNVEDQLNLMALAALGIDSFFRCYKKGEPKANHPHTAAQLQKVYADGIKYKSDMIYRCGVLKAYLLSLKTKEEIEALQWEDYERIKAQNEVSLEMEQSEAAQ